MEAIVLVLILLVCFNFVLKQTFQKVVWVWGVSLLCALFVALTWPWSIEQSKTQLRDWMNNPQLMLDTAVVLFAEVGFTLYSLLRDRTKADARWTLLKRITGDVSLLIFPVLFHLETTLMFTLTGIDFDTIAYVFSVVVLLLVPALTWMMRSLIPETELRLEISFLSNALVALLGVIATVNGRTAVAGISEVNFSAMAGMVGITLAMALIGFAVSHFRRRRRYHQSTFVKH